MREKNQEGVEDERLQRIPERKNMKAGFFPSRQKRKKKGNKSNLEMGA